MDITEWLKDTATASRAKQPRPIADPSESLSGPAAAPGLVVRSVKKKLRQHRKLGANSSILVPDHATPEAPTEHPKKRERRGDIRRASDVHHARDSSESSSPATESSPDSAVYRRRKRHKTHVDKYEPKRKRSRHTNKSPTHRVKSTRKDGDKPRKARKKMIKGKTAAAVVQSFSAPNVQRERLTVSNHCRI